MASKKSAKKAATPKKNGTFLTSFDGSTFNTDAKVLSAIPAGRELEVVSITTYNNKKKLDIRRFFRNDDDQWQPGNKGIRFDAKSAEAIVDTLSAKKEIITKELASE